MRLLTLLLVALMLAGCTHPNKVELSAEFEVPRITDTEQLTFKVKLVNRSSETLHDYFVVATAGDVVATFPAPDLPPHQERYVEGTVELGAGSGSFDFSARVLGEGICQISQVVRVARPEGVGGPAYTYAQQSRSQQQIQSLPNEPIELGDEEPGALVCGNLEPEDDDQDVDRLIARVETQNCKASKELLRLYKDQGNQRAGEFLMGHL